jgi:hypothetical protein
MQHARGRESGRHVFVTRRKSVRAMGARCNNAHLVIRLAGWHIEIYDDECEKARIGC